jgi:O-antigen/teichoic acid export membrane protein
VSPPTPRRNAVFAFGTQVSSALFTALLTLVLLRLLGSHGYGEFALAVAVGSLVILPADLGVSGSTARFVAEARGNRPAMRRVVAAGFRLKLAVSGGVAVALALLAGPIASAYGNPGLVWPLRAMAVALFGQGVMRFCVGSFSARERNPLSFLVVTGESAVEAAASIALVVAGGGATAAVVGRAIGYGAGATFGVAIACMLFRVTPRALLRRPPPGTARSLRRYAGALALADGVWSAFNQVDVLLIGAILSATDAGVFQAPLRLLVLASYPGLALGAAIGPRLAKRPGGTAVDARPLVDAMRLLLLAQGFAAAVLLAWSRPLTGLVFGSGYGASATVFVALTPYIFLGGLAPLLSNAIDYVGGTRRRIRVGAGALALNVVLDLILLPQLGVVGAAIGTDVAYAVYVVGHVGIASRLLDFRLAPVLVTGMRCLLAAAPMTGILVAGRELGIAGGAVAGVAGAAVYVSVLVVTGETRAQSRGLRRALRVGGEAYPGA